MFYSTGIPLSVIESQYCKEAFSAVAKCGPSYKLPTRKALSGNLLQFKTQMASTGATLVSDGWTNVQNRSILNFLAVTADKAMFIDGTDTSGEQKDAQYIAAEIKCHIQQLGAENIVQVVTDSAGNCAAARSVLADDFPTIAFLPCSAHCLDLLLEDIGKLPWASDIIRKGHTIMKFITNHQPLAFFRSHSTVELLKPGETRFASFFIMLQHVQHTKDALQETVMDRQYKQWLGSCKKLSMRDEGKMVSETLIDECFWRSVEELIIALLRMVDGVVPCVGKVYWQMYQIDLGVENSSLEGTDQDTQKDCWIMLHTDLHSAGFVLDPEYRLFLQHENEEVMSGFHAIVEKMFKDDVQAQVKAIEQHSTHRAGHGLFSQPMANAAAKEMQPFRWWLSFGAHIPELQKVAVHFLSQVSSASASEIGQHSISSTQRNETDCCANG